MTKNKKIGFGILSIIIILLIFYIGFFIGRVSMAKKDVHFEATYYLILAELMRDGNYERAQVLLDSSLRQSIVAIGVWGKYAFGYEKRSMLETVRGINNYYQKYRDGKILIDSGGFYKEVPSGLYKEASQKEAKSFQDNYNKIIKDTIEKATAEEEIEEYNRKNEKYRMERDKRIKKSILEEHEK